MQSKLTTILAAAALGLTATAGTAATLNLGTSGPALNATSASVTFLDIGDFAFSSFGSVGGASGITTGGQTDLFFDSEVSSSDPNVAIFGTLDISDEDGEVVTGDLVDFGFTDSTLEFLFDVLGGRFAADFGSQVLVEFTLDPGTGITFLSDLQDGDVLTGTLTAAGGVSPVPLPAGLPLLLAGLGGLWALRRRRTVGVA